MEMTEQAPSDGGDGDAYPERRSTQTALDVLQLDQHRLLFAGDPDRTPELHAWVDGFPDRRSAVNWWQAAAVRTFGHVAEAFPPRYLLSDETLVSRLVAEDDESGAYRQRLLRHMLAPACQQAFVSRRETAVERIQGEQAKSWEQLDPEKEKHIAMMPAHSQLDDEQAAVLSELWGGFDSRLELVQWIHSLTPATRGHHPDDLGTRLLSDKTATKRLRGDDRESARWREKFAIGVLLPAFAAAARSLSGGEKSYADSDTAWRTG